MKESKYQKKLIDEYTAKGYFVIKLIKCNINGLPDLLCLKKGETPLFIEVKNERGIVSELQKYRIQQLNELGFDAKIMRYEKYTK